MNAPDPISQGDLKTALQKAMAIEFCTIPAYLSGYWTVRDPYNQAATVIQRILVMEMRHLAIASNVLTAVGGTPDILAAAPVKYPVAVPDISREGTPGYLLVDQNPYGTAFLDTSKSIERPKDLPAACSAAFLGTTTARFFTAARLPAEAHVLDLHAYPSIGEFYKAIWEAIERYYGADRPFPDGAHLERQLRRFGPDDLTVRTSADAIGLLKDIVDEGEGDGGNLWDENGELSHFYAFDELAQERAYLPGDLPCRPTGPAVQVPRGDSQVVPMARNPRRGAYDKELLTADEEFSGMYTSMLTDLEFGFTGQPTRVQAAIGKMHQLRVLAEAVFRFPYPPDGTKQAGPTFTVTPPGKPS